MHGRVLRSGRQPTVTGSPGGGEEDPPTNPILSLQVRITAMHNNPCRNIVAAETYRMGFIQPIQYMFALKDSTS